MKAEFDMMFGKGISKAGEVLDMGVELGIIKKSGAWFSYDDSKLGQGRDAVKKLLEDNEELAEEIAEKIRAKLAENSGKSLPGSGAAPAGEERGESDSETYGSDAQGDETDFFADDFDIDS